MKRIGAVVLAAGESSRMGTVKALLEVGGRTALARTIDSLRAAGVTDIVVVTGYHAAEVTPAATALGAAVARNPRPERGMFSSVQTGAAALAAAPAGGGATKAVVTPGTDLEAFFVLPVDYPLVRPQVLTVAMDTFAGAECDRVHPCCGGLRGHPPLLAARLLAPLAGAPTDGDLRMFLDTHAAQAIDVEVDDLTVLLDMDTPADLDRLRGFSAHIDHPGRAAARLGEREALFLLELLKTPPNVVAHCREVARAGTAVARAVQAVRAEVDAGLVQAGCLVHDMVRGQGARKHALMAERILRNFGLLRLAEVVGGHMVLPLDPAASQTVTEEELVYLADKLVVEDRLVGLVGRERRALEKCGDDEVSRRGIRARMQVAEDIAVKVEALLGRSLDEVLAPSAPPGDAT